MNIDKLNNTTVRAAIEALQRGDVKGWSALFETGARPFDDGSPRSLEHSRATRWATSALPASIPSRTTASM
jgi:hypothetical protein